MRNWIIAALVILSLSGLGWVQYRLLIAGMVLERSRLDRDVETALRELNARLNGSEERRRWFSALLDQEGDRFRSGGQLMSSAMRDTLGSLLGDIFREQGRQVDFHLMAFYRPAGQMDSEPSRETGPGTARVYHRFLTGRIRWECTCEPYLELRVGNLLNLLLARMAYLIIPSAGFVLLLGICFGLLIHYLNRQRRLDRIKNDFINNLTHELKTPVFSVGLITRMLGEAIRQGRSEKALEYLTLIGRENDQLKEKVEKVLELASLENKPYQLHKKWVDVHRLLKELADAFQWQVREKGGSLRLDLAAPGAELCLDVFHFRSAVQNLLDNALKYNERFPEIVLTTQADDRKFQLSVSDNGIGIPREHQRRIFRKFYRVTSGDLHRVKGFGLGLSYVQQIVNAHGGRVRLRSRVGEGSTFMITLPFENRKIENENEKAKTAPRRR